MSQSKRMSLTEAVVNTAVGFVIALAAQALICWAYSIPLSLEQNSVIVFWMTVLSIVRSYILRRFFNARTELEAAEEYYESGIRNDG